MRLTRMEGKNGPPGSVSVTVFHHGIESPPYRGGLVKRAIMTGVGLAFAAISLAQPVKHKDWGKSAEAYFLTPAEKVAWSKVANDDEASKFIAEYWARRDPNPTTAANEFRDEVNRRIAAADEQFKMRSKRGLKQPGEGCS